MTHPAHARAARGERRTADEAPALESLDLGPLELVPTPLLRERPELGHARAGESGTRGNLLVHGDNLLALRALLPSLAGAVKCVYIDPPYNTGNAFSQYDDDVAHAAWIDALRERLVLLREVLRGDGSLWISIDDREAHYLKVLADEVFGRANFVAAIVVSTNPKGRQLDRFFAGAHEYLLCYARDVRRLQLRASSADDVDLADFPEEDEGGRFRYLPLRNTNKRFDPTTRPNLAYPVFVDAEGRLSLARAEGAREIWPVFGDGRPAVWRWSREKLLREQDALAVRQVKRRRGGLAWDLFQKDYCHAGREKKLKTLWLSEAIGSTDEAKAEVKALCPEDVFATPKPERLLARVVTCATDPGELVLDAYLGSGTTAAVAQKLGRRWIGIELGEHARGACRTRLQKVIDGDDPGGVSTAAAYSGGGSFRFFEIASERR